MNICEFKAAVDHWHVKEQVLQTLKPFFIGEDHQVDTYFNVPFGRLKLREGKIENALIHYQRKNTADAKLSNVLLYQHQPDKNLKPLLKRALGIKVIVNKIRKIYLIDNVKFHFDLVEGLGNFIEVEAIDKEDNLGIDKLKEQCDKYQTLLDIRSDDFIAESYSDLILEKSIF